MHIKKIDVLRGCTKVTLQTDNAAYYGGNLPARSLHAVAQQQGFFLKQFIHNESGDGKTILDAHFGSVTCYLNRYVCSVSS